MSLEQFGVVVCRGASLILLVMGMCSLLPILLALVFGPATELMVGMHVGWTRYAPPQFTSWTLFSMALRANAGAMAQVILAPGLFVFSRAVGRLLTTGLT